MVEYPLKHIRLEQLNKAGFNTPNFIHFSPRKLDLHELEKFFKLYKTISCCGSSHFS
jgi:hypothetical protein